MKKILSVMLAIMMLFGAMSINASAATSYDFSSQVAGKYLDSSTQAIVVLHFGATGSSKTVLSVYDTATAPGAFNWESGVTGSYYYLPGNGDAASTAMKAGSLIYLPEVTCTDETKECTGWQLQRYSINGLQKFAEGSYIALPDDCAGKIYEFVAVYGDRVPEEDTMAMVLGVLMKVFGTILGILFLDGNSAAGVELMQNVLGGLLG